MNDESAFTDAQLDQIRQIVREELATHPAGQRWRYIDGAWNAQPLPPLPRDPIAITITIDGKEVATALG